jgi:hypothetical protein
VNDNTNVPDDPSRWRAGELITSLLDMPPVGSAETDITRFYTFTVTDKTQEEMDEFLGTYHYNISMTVYEGPDPSGFRKIRVRNDDWNGNYSPDCDWTTENTGNIRDEWNERYPTCNLVITAIPLPDYFECEGTFTVGQAQEFEEVVIERGLAQLVRRRQWLISPAGMANIAAAGGHQEGTAQQLGGILDNRVVT